MKKKIKKEKKAKETKEIVQIEKKEVTSADLDNYLFGSNSKLTEQQKMIFKQTALALNLNPFKREIYAIPYGENMSLIVGYEVYIKRAERSGALKGWTVITSGTGQNLKAIVTIYRRGWDHPFVHEVLWSEYAQNNSMWQKKGNTMLKKVAISQAFRLVFPEELSGMPYIEEEIINKPDEKVVCAEVVTEKQIPVLTEAKPISDYNFEISEEGVMPIGPKKGVAFFDMQGVDLEYLQGKMETKEQKEAIQKILDKKLCFVADEISEKLNMSFEVFKKSASEIMKGKSWDNLPYSDRKYVLNVLKKRITK